MRTFGNQRQEQKKSDKIAKKRKGMHRRILWLKIVIKRFVFLINTHDSKEYNYAIIKKNALNRLIFKSESVVVNLGFKGVKKPCSLKPFIPCCKPRTKELTKE